jgi:pimeloyl-ACP methyl ester carboxylesterase
MALETCLTVGTPNVFLLESTKLYFYASRTQGGHEHSVSGRLVRSKVGPGGKVENPLQCCVTADLSRIRHPVLVANGDHDKMVPSSNSVDLARRLPHAELALYEDAGHGGVFQYHEAFVKKALEFFEA